ncbi:DUF4238 domain-containing protein [Pseudoxanthomonas wuyuanensis]|uniref:DUF4238 domain-containing protein n=1 Tax=Pseudoxanthomonas wuyuanensis TaxID=1073196 RepID=A0A286CXV1_9GAMM|nr:DUF4238 domain-containing protein [Pseudoxanthomonas wuyuanensis]KAF1722646.1 DUF4238 domain-containing protein [Pseudoxanthomonas wuyuanensis]SOD51236.1 Protein of unknown function [Pseudoxanthomonas wuyuanensis]
MSSAEEEKNKHHFVPMVYLKRFCNPQGELFTYRKDYPRRPKLRHPSQVGYEFHYYRQPTSDGGWDSNSIEDFLGRSVEDGWNDLVDYLLTREPLASQHYNRLAEFIAAQYARVPSTRNAYERLHAERLHHKLRYNIATGRIVLPPPPPALAEAVFQSESGELVDQLRFAVDPHASIHAIPEAITHAESVFNKSTFFLLHNTSGIPFVTSDNPVVWFDPTLPPDRLLPYVHQPDGHVLLLFPVTPWLLVYGATGYDVPDDWTHVDVSDADKVQQMNSMICRFAYERVFASSRQSDEVVLAHAELSPTMRTHAVTHPGNAPVMFWHWVFDKRWHKAPWNDGKDDRA